MASWAAEATVAVQRPAVPQALPAEVQAVVRAPVGLGLLPELAQRVQLSAQHPLGASGEEVAGQRTETVAQPLAPVEAEHQAAFAGLKIRGKKLLH